MHTVTLQLALDEGLLWKLQQNLPPDHELQEMTEAEYYDWVKAGCADEERFFTEYMRIAAAADAAYLEYDLIAAAEYKGDSDWTQWGSGALLGGVDIGRKTDLTGMWVLLRMGGGTYRTQMEGPTI